MGCGLWVVGSEVCCICSALLLTAVPRLPPTCYAVVCCCSAPFGGNCLDAATGHLPRTDHLATLADHVPSSKSTGKSSRWARRESDGSRPRDPSERSDCSRRSACARDGGGPHLAPRPAAQPSRVRGAAGIPHLLMLILTRADRGGGRAPRQPHRAGRLEALAPPACTTPGPESFLGLAGIL